LGVIEIKKASRRISLLPQNQHHQHPPLPLPTRHDCPRWCPSGRATPMSKEPRGHNPLPFQRLPADSLLPKFVPFMPAHTWVSPILSSFFPPTSCLSLLLRPIPHLMKMPCIPPYYPSPGHESRITHDSASSCQYYAVWQGRVRGIYTNS
jgi:hypothetical protein